MKNNTIHPILTRKAKTFTFKTKDSAIIAALTHLVRREIRSCPSLAKHGGPVAPT
jgi:hypothetical protein